MSYFHIFVCMHIYMCICVCLCVYIIVYICVCVCVCVCADAVCVLESQVKSFTCVLDWLGTQSLPVFSDWESVKRLLHITDKGTDW